MAVAVNDIIDKVEILLQDTTNIRWSAAELLAYANDAINEIVREKPEANVTTASVAWTQGTKQTLPTGGLVLIDVVRNMGTAGTVAGPAIRLIDRAILDATLYDWHEAKYQSATIQHWMFNPNNPKVWYIYPGSDGTTQGEISYSAVIAPIAAGANIGLDDIYQSVIMDYMLYRAHSKDADYNPNKELAINHYSAFLTALGAQDRAERLLDPTKAYVLKDKVKYESKIDQGNVK